MDTEDELTERRETVNRHLDERTEWGVEPSIHESSRYLLYSGGKRLRPVLLILAAEATAEKYDTREVRRRVMPAAVGVELIHSFSLVHDDIMDRDDYRRGVETVEKRWSQPAAILTGDFLFSQGFRHILDCDVDAEKLVRATQVVSDGCSDLCRGQSLDIEFEERHDVTEDEYLKMVEWKTARLFDVAGSVGSILMDGNESEVEALSSYGSKMGKAFQIKDDLLDITKERDVTGKPRGSDLTENKNTLISIHARRNGVEVGRAGKTSSRDEVESLITEIKEVGSVDYARDCIDELVREAREELSELPDDEPKNLLSDLTGYVAEREK